MAESKLDISQMQIDYKDACRAATTANISNILTGAPDILDGFNLSAGDRVLAKDQTTQSENGIYKVVSVGTGSNGVWERDLDFDEDTDPSQGIVVPVIKGTSQTKTLWMLMTPDPIVVGTTALDFQQLTSAQSDDLHWRRPFMVMGG